MSSAVVGTSSLRPLSTKVGYDAAALHTEVT